MDGHGRILGALVHKLVYFPSQYKQNISDEETTISNLGDIPIKTYQTISFSNKLTEWKKLSKPPDFLLRKEKKNKCTKKTQLEHRKINLKDYNSPFIIIKSQQKTCFFFLDSPASLITEYDRNAWCSLYVSGSNNQSQWRMNHNKERIELPMKNRSGKKKYISPGWYNKFLCHCD